MRIVLRTMILLTSLTVFCILFSIAQTPETSSTLLRELGSAQTTDRAAAQLLKRAQTEITTREYLAAHLPSMIQAGPQPPLAVWYNCVKLAGELRIAEAAPSLAKWVSIRMGSPANTLSEEAALKKSPAGTALVQIGDPAVPALEVTLRDGNLRDRWQAAYALNLIGTVKAKAALRDHLTSESDDSLRDFISRTVSK